jgi:hypothetical protein
MSLRRSSRFQGTILSTRCRSRRIESQHGALHCWRSWAAWIVAHKRKWYLVYIHALAPRPFGRTCETCSVATLGVYVRTNPRIGATTLTSKKPLMKLGCSLAFGSSSARKYLRTWDVCFQKFNVSLRVLAYFLLCDRLCKGTVPGTPGGWRRATHPPSVIDSRIYAARTLVVSLSVRWRRVG